MSTSNPRPPRALPALVDPPNQRPSRSLPPIKSPNKPEAEGQSVPRRTPRRRKEKTTTGRERAEDDSKTHKDPVEADATNVRSVDDKSVVQPQRRERRRRRPKEPTTQQEPTEALHRTLISELENDEDLVNVERVDGPVSLSNLPGIATGIGGSAGNDRVYIQTTNGFVSRNQQWVDKRNEAAEHGAHLPYGEDRVKPFDIAEQSEKGFMYITLALHGALAGFSIFHVIFSYSLYQQNQTQNFLTQYQYLAVPIQSVYYIILSLLVVSSLDRYDFASKDKHFFDSLVKFDLAAVSVVVYFVTFGFSIGLSGLDAWIGSGVGITSDSVSSSTTAATTLAPELTGSLLDAASTVSTWLIINVLRMVFSVLGWLIVAFDPLRNDMTWESQSPTRNV